MELTVDPLCEPAISEANHEHLSLSDHLSSVEAPLDGIEHGIEATDQNGGLELKLDLYVPIPPIIEPITPVEETVEHCVFPVATQEDDTQPEATKGETDANAERFQCENQPSLAESSSDTVTEAQCEQASNKTGSSDCKAASCEPEETVSSKETPEKHDSVKSSSGSKVYIAERKNIPPKKDKFNPLRIDMAKVIPLTSSQLSLQCMECHIIFSDSKSKDRHIKLSHPAEYQKKMLGDAVFTCYVCDQSFTCSTELMAHQRTHTDNERFKCPFCSEAFYTSSELTSHKKKMHYSKHGYSCTECGKPFKTFTLLRYHQRVHTAEKPYVCPHEACDKMFSTSKSLRNHLQKHQKEDGKGDQTYASTTIKKKKTKETNERKFPCPHCEAVFKASKARLLHIKNKHSLESQSSTVLVPQPKAPGPTLVQTANGQPPTLFVETVGPASHLMDANKLDAVQIKRLIEKLGNVQKVNQLVILPLQPQRFGLPPQPLHVNFTQPTQCEQRSTDPSNADQNNPPNLQPKEAAVLSQEEKSFSSENAEIQVTPVELTQTEAQMQTEEIHLELIPIQTEPSVLLDQMPLQVEASQNNSVHELAHTIEENITVTQANETLETNEEPPLIPQPEMEKSNHMEGVAALERINDPALNVQPETSKSYHVEGVASLETNDEVIVFSQPEAKTKPNHVEGIAAFEINNEPPLISQSEMAKSNVEEDIVQVYSVASEEILSKTEMACPTQNSIDILIGSHSELVIKQGDINKLSKSLEHLPIQAQNDQVELEQEQCIVEPQPQPDSLNSVQIDTIVNQQSSVPTPNQTQAGLQDSAFVQKKLPTKKKRSKKQLGDELENKEPIKEGDNTAASSKKVKTSSKVNPKKKENAKNKKLVVRFGPSEKKKSSKPKVIKTSKTKQNQNQQICDEGNVPALSQNDSKLDSNQKLQKDKKGKGVESPSGATVKPVGQIINATGGVLVAPEAAQQGKPQKRKMKNPNNLVKKAKSVPDAQQDKPVPKKKKQPKISEDDGPKKPKVRKTQNEDFKKKTQKITKHKLTKAKSSPDVPDQAHIEKQALLLLKGHKQPQLKVHKLDATELEKSPPSKNNNKVLQKNKNAQNKSLNVAHQKKKKPGANKLLEQQLLELQKLEMPLVENSPGSVPTKPKIVRKRKAPIKMDQEIALSPPYSQLTLGCQDCGKTFSEVSALQQHMASWHSAGKLAFSDEINVAKKRVIQPSPNEKRILSNVFEIHVATDWDIETEVGEIVGERLSFPALSPSPSLTLASNGADGKEQGEDKGAEGIVLGFEEPAEKTSSEVCEISTKSSIAASVQSSMPREVTEGAVESVSEKEQSNEFSPITEMSCDKIKDAAEEEIKEELPLGVNLIMIGDQNAEENHNTEMKNISGVSQECENEVSNSYSQTQEPTKDAETILNQNVLTEPEIKQEEEEVLVRGADDHKRVMGGNSVKKGKKGVGRARGKKSVGRRTSTETRSKKDIEVNKEPEECQVLYHLCIVDSPETKNKETDKNGVNASETSQASTSEEAPEEQVVFELDSVTTSVMDIVNSEEGSFETSRELAREGSSPGIILEKFLTARERNMETPNTQHPVRQANSKMDARKVISACTSSDVKMEERSSNLTQHNLTSSEGGSLRGVQMFLVKAEDHLSTTEIFQTLQPAHPQRVACPDKAVDKAAVPIQNYSKQCIFYPVKEEERELLVESPPATQTSLSSREHAGASSGLEECEEIRVDSVQMDMQQLYTNSEEGDVISEQQRTQGFLEFLSENTDAVDAGNIHSEPEAETIVMSCYHGIQSNGTMHQNGTERSDPSGRANGGVSPVSHREPERQLWTPITYFNQYFSLDTWKEIAVCTSDNLPNPFTEKEVAIYVGIHIAMGTLKFPSTKLYWEDYTRVPLISDAMSASRFSELACKLKLVGSARSSTETSIDQPSEETNREQPGQSNKAAHDCTNSKTDPLWKVMPLIRRVQDGCQALDRSGSYGVDQYPLPFQRHPTHSLLHTVVISGGGLVLDFSLSVDDSNRENVVEKMVSKGKERNEGMVFLCKPELSTPSMLEHLLEAGVQSAGKVGGARGQIGDEFVSSDGKLKLFRCHHGFILSAMVKEKPRSTSLVSGFERAIKAANLNRDLRSLYRTPCTNSAVSSWPQSVLWDLIDLVLVNAWIQYKQDYRDITDLLSLMAFRLEVAKALILSSGVDTQDSSPPCPPAPKLHDLDTNPRPSQVLDSPLPDEHTRYDGFGHWPEQLTEGEEARRCRFGGCERTSRVRCLKCCVYLCISRNHNCFLKFHSQGSS